MIAAPRWTDEQLEAGIPKTLRSPACGVSKRVERERVGW